MSEAIEIAVRHRQGDFALDVAFGSEGGLTALFGRSGAGKTTVINAVAGLLRPAEGRIVIGGRVLFDSARGLWTPPHRRRVGYVFQEGRLLPHLSVRRNLLYGRWFAPREAPDVLSFDAAVELLGLGALLDRRPDGLSGGEKQRVAIGRALLARPGVLLMDEPLASLDGARKAEIIPVIERLRDELRLPILYVSHAVAEVARLATRLVVLEGGRVAAHGAPADVLNRIDAPDLDGDPGTLIEAEISGHDAVHHLSTLTTPAGPLQVRRLAQPVGARVRVRIRASDVLVSLDRLERVSALNAFTGIVTDIAPTTTPGAMRLRLECGRVGLIAGLTSKSVAALGLEPGVAVHATIKSVAVDALEQRTGGSA